MPSLHWTGKDAAVVAAREVPYRPLVAVPDLSHGDPDTGNLLIHGDNLNALKSLLPLYAGRVKCIFIDPPYNTGSAFENADDNREHHLWDRWRSVDEIAEYLGVSKDTVYPWVNQKGMPGHKVGRFWKFKSAEVDDWVRAGGAARATTRLFGEDRE